MKIETSWFYFSIDRDGFFLELGNIDEGTSIFTIAFTRNWCPEWLKGILP